MEILSIKNLASKIKEKENQLDYYMEKKNKALIKVLPRSKELKGEMVTSSRDVTNDALLEYVLQIEEYDKIISQLNDELLELQKFEEKELKRLEKYDNVEQQVIHYRNMGISWSNISNLIDQRKIGCSLRTAKRIWKKYTGRRDIYDEEVE